MESGLKFGNLAIDAMIEENPRVKEAKRELVERIDKHTELLKEVKKGLRAQKSLDVFANFAKQLTGREPIPKEKKSEGK